MDIESKIAEENLCIKLLKVVIFVFLLPRLNKVKKNYKIISLDKD